MSTALTHASTRIAPTIGHVTNTHVLHVRWSLGSPRQPRDEKEYKKMTLKRQAMQEQQESSGIAGSSNYCASCSVRHLRVQVRCCEPSEGAGAMSGGRLTLSPQFLRTSAKGLSASHRIDLGRHQVTNPWSVLAAVEPGLYGLAPPSVTDHLPGNSPSPITELCPFALSARAQMPWFVRTVSIIEFPRYQGDPCGSFGPLEGVRRYRGIPTLTIKV